LRTAAASLIEHVRRGIARHRQARGLDAACVERKVAVLVLPGTGDRVDRGAREAVAFRRTQRISGQRPRERVHRRMWSAMRHIVGF
jgi:hypothetical protein